MTMLDLDQALKQLRLEVLKSMDTPRGVPASVFVPWANAPIHVPLPSFSDQREPTQVQKATDLFQLGFLLTTQPQDPLEIEYILFTSVMWMVRRPVGKGIQGTPSQQADRGEFLQVIHSLPEANPKSWMYPVQRHGPKPTLGMATMFPGMVTTLTAAFWAGVDVGKVQHRVYEMAQPSQEGGP
jgi:hypothetical protein